MEDNVKIENPTVLTEDNRAEAKKRKAEEKKRRREIKRLKREYEKKKKIVPVRNRPIVCPPDRLGEGRGKVIAGFACRAALIFITVFAFSFFLCDAFGFVTDYAVTPAYLALWSLLYTAIFSAMALVRYAWIPGIFAIAAAAVLPLMNTLMSNPLRPFINIYYAAILHLSKNYYYDTTGMTVTPSLVAPTVSLLILVIAAIFVPCLIRRVHILPPAIFSGLTMWAVFMYNLTRSNWGVTLLIASFSALIVMAVYDSIYVRPPKKNSVDENVSFFGTEDEPQLPDSVLQRDAKRAEARADRAARREAKRARRRAEKEHTVTVAEELDDYFSDPSAKKKKERAPKVKLTPEQKNAKRAEARAAKAEARRQKREERKAVARVRDYHTGILNARCAVGGFAGAGIFVLAMLLLVLPALTVHGRFKTIEVIDKKMEFYRDYVTALLMGDDPSLDLLAYEGNKANFAPHSAEATPRYFQNIPIMRVDSNLRQYSVYMRGWVGVDYKDGSWYTGTPGDPVFEDYRSMFSTYIDPSEYMFSSLFSVMAPGSVPTDVDYTTRTRSNSTYGFGISQVNILRNDFKSMLLYMPSYSLRSFAVTGTTSSGKNAAFLRAFGSAEASKITFADYFDGMYTSYRASRDTDGYATVSMLTSMKSEGFYRNVSDLIVNYNLLRMAVGSELFQSDEPPLRIDEYISDDMILPLEYKHYSVVRFLSAKEHEQILDYYVAYNTDGGQVFIRVPQKVGVARYIIGVNSNIQRKIVDIPPEMKFDEEGNEIIYSAPALNYIIRYFELMTDAERKELEASYRMTDFYTPYVYKYYAGNDDSDSEVIAALVQKIISEAMTTVTEEYDVTEVLTDPVTGAVLTDPVTGEPLTETYTLTRKVKVPLDLSRAAEHNTYRVVENYDKKTQTTTYTNVFDTGVLDREVYIQRHELVMEFVNYLAQNDNYKYTLRPAQSAVEGSDPVDAFLNETYEGYCVQFASALTLMLREAGIPARYVEGYLATGFNTAPKDYAAAYTTTVRDSNAHAWVEVWYDGIGWLQYEATPAYYSAMYAVDNGSTPIRPSGPNGEGEEEPDEPGPEELTPEELAELIRQQQEALRRERIRKLILTVSIIAGVSAAIAAVFTVLFLSAKRKEKIRAALIGKLADAPASEPTREEVRRAGELIYRLLAEVGLSPEVGEFGPEFAARVHDDVGTAVSKPTDAEKVTELEAARLAMSADTVAHIFEAISSEEFGYGADPESLPLLARFYKRLYAHVYRRRVSPVRRVWLWLFRQVL